MCLDVNVDSCQINKVNFICSSPSIPSPCFLNRMSPLSVQEIFEVLKEITSKSIYTTIQDKSIGYEFQEVANEQFIWTVCIEINCILFIES